MPLKSSGRARVWLAFAFLLALLIASAVGLYRVSDLSKLQDKSGMRESRTAERADTVASQIEAALARRPSDPVLQTMAMATRAANETSAAIEELSGEIEPPSLAQKIDVAAASRSQLEALRRDFETAASNTTSLKPRYLALLKAERDKVESYAGQHAGTAVVARLLETIDKRHAELTTSISTMLAARADFYRAYDNYLAFLIGQSGAYTVADGRLIFPTQETVDRYTASAAAMTASAKRVLELEEERKKLLKSQQEQWLQFVRSL